MFVIDRTPGLLVVAKPVGVHTNAVVSKSTTLQQPSNPNSNNSVNSDELLGGKPALPLPDALPATATGATVTVTQASAPEHEALTPLTRDLRATPHQSL